VFNVN